MKSFIYKIYTYNFFSDLIFIYPVYAVMFVDSGLNPLQISILLMVWAGTAFLLEVPSGVLADKYSRKNILLLGQLIRIIGYAFWIFIPNFIGFLIGFILWGIKSALTSGTLESFVYDELKVKNREQDYTKILGRLQGISYMAILFSGIGASIAVSLGYGFVLIMSIISLAISSTAVLLIPSVKPQKSTNETKYFELLKKGFNFSIKTPSIFRIIIFVALAQALFGALDEYWSIFADQSGLPKVGLGIFFVLYGLVQVIATSIAYKFEHKTSKFFEFLFFINGILLLIAAYFYQVPVLILLLVLSFLFKLSDTVMQGRLQHEVTEGDVRATITSVKGFFVEFAVLGFYLVFGLISKNFGYQTAFMSIGVLISVIGLSYLISKRDKQLSKF